MLKSIAPRSLRAPGCVSVSLPLPLLGLLLRHGVLHPRQRDQEQRRQHHAKQDVDPGEPDVIAAHTETGDEGTKRAAKGLFQVVAPQIGVQISVKALHGEYFSHVRTQSEAVTAVQGSLVALPPGRWVLAVSGGRDSMVLLDAMARERGAEIAAVATFDHGTGAAAKRAVELVERTGLRLELPVVSGVMEGAAPNEAAWRAARWRFLNSWAEERRATVVTAHTRDDQVETVVIRLLRDAGPRGLAGMLAKPSTVARPFLPLSRSTIGDYASAEDIAFIEDPSNGSMVHQRNRVRHELLPAFERAQPGFAAWCWDISARAASWRSSVVDYVNEVLQPVASNQGLILKAAPLRDLDSLDWAVLWPELVARADVTMDWRGIERASAWARHAKPGAGIPLAGGAVIERTASTFVIRRAAT